MERNFKICRHSTTAYIPSMNILKSENMVVFIAYFCKMEHEWIISRYGDEESPSMIIWERVSIVVEEEGIV